VSAAGPEICTLGTVYRESERNSPAPRAVHVLSCPTYQHDAPHMGSTV